MDHAAAPEGMGISRLHLGSRLSVPWGTVVAMRDASRWTTKVHTNDDTGQIVRVTVSWENEEKGKWVPGYPDVSATYVGDKDEVRRVIRDAIGAHVMYSSLSPAYRAAVESAPSVGAARG